MGGEHQQVVVLLGILIRAEIKLDQLVMVVEVLMEQLLHQVMSLE